jgi:uncharacterized protein (TIRG00374 family)
MQQPKPKLTKKTFILPLIGIAAFLLYIYLFKVDLQSILRTAQNAKPLPYIAAILMSFVEILFYSLSWNELLKGLKVKLTLLKAHIFVWYAMFLDILVPAESISGEICRVYLVNREQRGTSGKVAASLMTYRLISMVMNSTFLLLGAALLFGTTQIHPLVFNTIQILMLSSAIFMILLIAISWKENWSTKIINSTIRAIEYLSRGKYKLEKIRQESFTAARMFHTSMKDVIRNPQKLTIPTFYLALNWLSSMTIPYLVFLSLGYIASWGVILVTTSIVVAVKSIPAGIPFEVGLPEITMMTLYTAGGVPPEIAATSTILSRIITLWLRFGVGFTAFQWTELQDRTHNNKPETMQENA